MLTEPLIMRSAVVAVRRKPMLKPLQVLEARSHDRPSPGTNQIQELAAFAAKICL